MITKLSPSALLDSSLALALAVLLLVPPVARTQQDSATEQDSARLAGTVFSSSNGRPLAGVIVAVRGTPVFDVSDAAGSFTLAGLPSGQQTLRIRYGDTLSYDHVIALRRAQTVTLSVLLAVDAVELTPIVVEARSPRAERSLAGFYDRKRSGFGRYYTLEEIERRRLTLRALLLETGVQVRCGRGRCVPVGSTNGRVCLMTLLLNGMRFTGEDINLIHLDEVAGVEVYTRGLDVPNDFRAGSSDGCGAILMWSR